MHIVSRLSNFVVLEEHFQKLPLRVLIKVVKLAHNVIYYLFVLVGVGRYGGSFDMLGGLLSEEVLLTNQT